MRDGDILAGPEGRRVIIRPDREVDDMWEVVQYDRGGGRNPGDPLGSVFQERGWDDVAKVAVTDDLWTASRHTYTGIPARQGEGYTTREDAAAALFGAYPFHGDRRAANRTAGEE